MDIEDMNPEARRVVELAREARTPGEADKRRVRQAIALGLGAATAGAASSVAASAVAKGGAAGLLAGLRGVALVVAVATAGAGTVWWARARGHASGQASTTAVAPLAAPAAAPVVIEPLAPAALPDPLVAEVSLLRQAQQALRDGRPALALALAQRHATLYPRSQMSLEGGALQVFSFCALGRKTEARRLATELLARAPRSPLRTSLEESCAITPTR